MPLRQQRPNERPLYDPLGVDYKPWDEIQVLLDNEDWENTKRYPATGFGGSGSSAAYAKETLTGLLSKTVDEIFNVPFSSTPQAVNFKVYRYYEVESGSGEYVRKDVTFSISGSGWITTTGFTIQIDADESLTGVYIDYLFM